MRYVTACLILLLSVPCLAAGPATQPADASVKVIRDLKYGDGPNRSNLLDIYMPVATDGDLRPLIVWVHGGANVVGDKGVFNPHPFIDAGFVVASINYRFLKDAIFPGQLYDCKGAVRWLRANAAKYDIDPKRVGAWGASAGGHHVALLGTTGGIKELEGTVGGNLDQSSRVQAVVDWFGPTDMYAIKDQVPDDYFYKKFPAISPVAGLFGGLANCTPQKLAQANPITYITPDDPPFLVMHGDKDPLVPLAQSKMFVDALKAKNMPAELDVVKGGNHGRNFPPDTRDRVMQFFKQELITDWKNN